MRKRHRHFEGQGHAHGVVGPGVAASGRGIRTLAWSFAGLALTALIQTGVVLASGSVGLLADAIHNFADAATAIPLAVAFLLARMAPTRRFPHGYGRVEDLAGVFIVATVLGSAVLAGYEAFSRLLHPTPVEHLGAVAGASLVGFLGNEAVAVFRIRVGREIGSAALVADGYHARVDGLTSLAVLAGAVGVWLGYPAADALSGLLITLVILRVVWTSTRAVLGRMLDAVEPAVLDGVEHAARHVPGVRGVGEVRGRWSGHALLVDVNVAVEPGLSVAEGHAVAKEVRHRILHHVPHVARVMVHVDPLTEPGEEFHRVSSHAHDDLPTHSHA